ncbi:HlyD family type I secretion periplasmic adaptor subunit [Thalassovita sp.]|uniref:HlyD family type I secretion periplasmic adaptor subunit n=1 Tax=Thalassovita sp. TaxID=1979401 RepID=UPI0029DE776F|nr:HlyD family type I secretion periplasmic adaptor subunit [Thalassovita sp.]
MSAQTTDTGFGFSLFLPKLIGFGSIIMLLGGFATWAMLAQIDGAVVASGRIIIDRNRQAVQHQVGGIVDQIFVAEGDSVKAGATLVKLDPTLTLSELAIVEGQLYELMARRGRLEAERDQADIVEFDPQLIEAAQLNPDVMDLMDGQARLFEARLDSLDKSVTQLANQREQLENQIGGIDAQMASAAKQLTLIQEEAHNQEILLKKGLAQTSRVLNLQREAARLAGLEGELTARRAQAMQQIAEISIQELRLHSQRREEAISTLRDLGFNEMEMTERRRALMTQLDRMDIKAPISGVVYDLRLFGPRSVIRPADAVMYIIPQDRPLIIEAEVNTIDIDKIYTNQEVVLRFASFDMRSTPDLFGRVTRVSPDAFNDPQTGRSYYRTEIELPNAEVAKLPEGQSLIPGMPAETFIRTGEYTPFAYLTRPVTRYFQRAMRDDG